MPSCVVKCCRNHSGSKKKCHGITFHRFPTENEVWRSDLINIIRECRGENDWVPSKSSVICSIHFNANDLYTTKGGTLRVVTYAVPKKFLFVPPNMEEIKRAEPSVSNAFKECLFVPPNMEEIQPAEPSVSKAFKENISICVLDEEFDIQALRDDALHREPNQQQPNSSSDDTDKEPYLKTPTKSIGIPVNRRPLKRGLVPSVYNKIEKQTLIKKQNLIKRAKKQKHTEAVTETPEDDPKADLIKCGSPRDVILGENPTDVTLGGSPADVMLDGSPPGVILGESPIDYNSSSELKVVCRLCLVSNVKMLHLHSQPLGIYYENTIGVNLQSTMELPPYACYNCAALIKKFYHFKIECSRGQTILYDMINNYGMITVQELQLVNRKKLLPSSNFAIQQLPEPIRCMHEDDFVNRDINEEQDDYITIEVEGLTDDLQYIDRNISSESELTNIDSEHLIYSSSDDELLAVHKNKEGKNEVNEHGMKKRHSKRKKSPSVDLSELFEEVTLKPIDDTINRTSKLVKVKKRKCGRPWKKNTINAEISRLTENKEVDDDDAENSRLTEYKEVDDDDAEISRLTENKEVDDDDAEISRLTENKEVDDDDAENSRLTENKEVDDDDAENSIL